MDKVKLTKEEAKRLMGMGGNARGLVLKTAASYIIEKKGRAGLEKVEKRLETLGYPFKLERTLSLRWYPIGLTALVSLLAMEEFGWNKVDIFDMAYKGPINSIVSRLVFQALTIEKAFKNFDGYWRQYCDSGKWEVINYDLEKKTATLHFKNFKKYYPAIFYYFMGFVKKVIEIVTKSQTVEVKQTKSIFDGDPYDEAQIKW